MDEKNVKEAISICTTHIEYIDDVLYSISKLVDKHSIKEGASDKAYDMLSEIKRIRIDDRTHKAVIGVQET